MKQVRIIGGEHKRRQISFIETQGLRPTPDRVRETLFNWLQPHLQGARVVDCFAGSGVLGLEALSRGASFCTFIETNKKQLKQIELSAQALGLGAQAEFFSHKAELLLPRLELEADLAFVDPPYQLELWLPALEALRPKLNTGALVYIEANKPLEALTLKWLSPLKALKAGQIHAGLFERT